MHPQSDQFSLWGNFKHLWRQSGIHLALKSPHREGEGHADIARREGEEGERESTTTSQYQTIYRLSWAANTEFFGK